MDTSPIYIEAAETGIADARSLDARTGGAPKAYTLGLQAVRYCGYKTPTNRGRNAVSYACYILGSIPDDSIHALMSSVHPSIPTVTRIFSLLDLPAMKSSAKLKGAMKRKTVEICDDILLSFHGTLGANEAANTSQLIEGCYGQLLQAQQVAKKALENCNKKNTTIKALLESKYGAEESRRRAEKSRVARDNLIQALGAQLYVEVEESTAVVSSTTTMSNEN